jgi:hypothetical protein
MTIGKGIPHQKCQEDLVTSARNIGNEVFQVPPLILFIFFLLFLFSFSCPKPVKSLVVPLVKAQRLLEDVPRTLLRSCQA